MQPTAVLAMQHGGKGKVTPELAKAAAISDKGADVDVAERFALGAGESSDVYDKHWGSESQLSSPEMSSSSTSESEGDEQANAGKEATDMMNRNNNEYESESD